MTAKESLHTTIGLWYRKILFGVSFSGCPSDPEDAGKKVYHESQVKVYTQHWFYGIDI